MGRFYYTNSLPLSLFLWNGRFLLKCNDMFEMAIMNFIENDAFCYKRDNGWILIRL